MNELLAAALELAWRGDLVLPLHHPSRAIRAGCSCMRSQCGKSAGKHPRTLNGFYDATDNIETITGWWRRWPLANLGIRPQVRQIVIDTDPRHGGDRTLTDWEHQHNPLPPTRTAATGGGGLHLWFTVPDGLAIVGELGPGVDIKTHSGYVVAPPSLHLSGQRYSWRNEGRIAEAPAELLAAITRKPPPPRTSHPTADPGRRVTALCRVIEDAGPGKHNRALYWAALRACEAGLDPAPLADTALRVGRDTPAQVQRTIASAARAATRKNGAA